VASRPPIRRSSPSPTCARDMSVRCRRPARGLRAPDPEGEAVGRRRLEWQLTARAPLGLRLRPQRPSGLREDCENRLRSVSRPAALALEPPRSGIDGPPSSGGSSHLRPRGEPAHESDGSPRPHLQAPTRPVARRSHVDESTQRAAGEIHRPRSGLAQDSGVRLWADTDDEIAPHDAAAHSPRQHETDPTEHPALGEAGQTP
jgi:hypothetical protein